jgi:hypothetical protein
VNEEWDFKAFLALRRRGQLGLLAWLRSLLAVESFALAARNDWRPIAVAFYRLARGFLAGRELQ